MSTTIETPSPSETLRLTDRYMATAGTVAGSEHVRLHRDNQDGVALAMDGGAITAVVADGCGSGRWSEVGARLGASWLASWSAWFFSVIPEDHPDPTALERARLDVLVTQLTRYLGLVGRSLRPGRLEGTVRDHLLFTFLVAVVRPSRTIVFGIGDGVVRVNGRTTVLDAGPGNAPLYVGYRLLDRSVTGLDPAAIRASVHHAGPTAQLESVIVATDGAAELDARAEEPLPDGRRAGGLAALATDARYVRNPSLLQKRLIVLGALHRRLKDDTSVALVRRR